MSHSAGMLRSVVLSGVLGWVMVASFVLAMPDVATGARQGGDVFAWLMRIQNLLEQKQGRDYTNRGELLETTFTRAYPDACRECGRKLCQCPDLLASTVGRIAKEDPATEPAAVARRFMSPDEQRALFHPG